VLMMGLIKGQTEAVFVF